MNVGGGTINYDIEAIKLDRVRHAWPNGGRAHSISSEASLSDCEAELGGNSSNYHVDREAALQHQTNSTSSKVLWDEVAIEASLRSFLTVAFDGNESIWDTLEQKDDDDDDDVLHQNNITITAADQLSQVEKDAKLLWAAWRAQIMCMTKLLSTGASPNSADGEGRSALHLACCNANPTSVKLLLSHGAKINCFDKQKLAAPLFCAVASGTSAEAENVVQVLLDAGADINFGLHQLGVSALHVAVRANAVTHVRKLLKHGAVPNHAQLFRYDKTNEQTNLQRLTF